MPERWTRAVLRRRTPILLCWIAVVAVGAFGATRLTALLATSFAVPGTDSGTARTRSSRTTVRERTDGVFTVVFATRGDRRQLRARLAAAASVVPTATVGQILSGGGVASGGDSNDARPPARKAVHPRHPPRPRRRSVPSCSGQPAIQHDLDPILSSDLKRGETIALPIALAVLIAVLGISFAVVVPFAFAAGTIALTLAIVYGIAHAC